jgi:hypothetical protein
VGSQLYNHVSYGIAISSILFNTGSVITLQMRLDEMNQLIKARHISHVFLGLSKFFSFIPDEFSKIFYVLLA